MNVVLCLHRFPYISSGVLCKMSTFACRKDPDKMHSTKNLEIITCDLSLSTLLSPEERIQQCVNGKYLYGEESKPKSA